MTKGITNLIRAQTLLKMVTGAQIVQGNLWMELVMQKGKLLHLKTQSKVIFWQIIDLGIFNELLFQFQNLTKTQTIMTPMMWKWARMHWKWPTRDPKDGQSAVSP